MNPLIYSFSYCALGIHPVQGPGKALSTGLMGGPCPPGANSLGGGWTKARKRMHVKEKNTRCNENKVGGSEGGGEREGN